MAGGRFLFGFGAVPNQILDIVYNPGNIERHRFTPLRALVYFRLAALTWADTLSSFALYVMMNYLVNVWNLSTTHAAGIINIFYGITMALVIAFAVFVDAFLGDFYMLVFTGIAYGVGLGLLSFSTPTFFGSCSQYKDEYCVRHLQKIMFFTALSLIAIGMAGHAVSLRSFLDLQRPEAEAENEDEDEAQAHALVPSLVRAQNQVHARAKAKLWLIAFLLISMIVIISGGIALPYIKPWSIRFAIPTICVLTSTVWFLTGSRQFKHSKLQEQGSPLMAALRVFVAAATKDFQQVANFKQIYNDNDAQSTDTLRWFDKAAIKFPDQARSKSWTLCSVHEVEDTKTVMRMVPMLLTFIGTGSVLSLGNTYFLDQADHTDRKLGSINIHIQIFFIFYYSSSMISQRIFALFVKRIPIQKRYYAPTEIGIGMFLSMLCCITAAIVETRRLHDKPTTMSVFVLLPQFVLLGSVDGITESGFRRFCGGRVPESMQKYVEYLQFFVLGLGRMGNVLWVYVVGKVSPNWFQHTINKSRLDRFYWTLAALSVVNLVIYAFVASFYKYDDNDDDNDAATAIA